MLRVLFFQDVCVRACVVSWLSPGLFHEVIRHTILSALDLRVFALCVCVRVGGWVTMYRATPLVSRTYFRNTCQD